MTNSLELAYTLAQHEAGWRWCVIDGCGETVAAGFELARTAAIGAIEGLMQTYRDAAELTAS
jgi:hypothetical protein